jgi:hypothetical protein
VGFVFAALTGNGKSPEVASEGGSMTDEEKLRKIALLYGERVPECLTFVLDCYFDKRLSSTEYKGINDTFYPRTGIYWDKVTIKDEDDVPVLRDHVIQFMSLRLLVLKNPDQVRTSITLRERVYRLFKAENLFAPYHEIEFPIDDDVEIDDDKTPID